jgi:hypothetical protein
MGCGYSYVKGNMEVRALDPWLLIWTLPLEPSDCSAFVGKSSRFKIRSDKYDDPKMFMLEPFNVLRLHVL